MTRSMRWMAAPAAVLCLATLAHAQRDAATYVPDDAGWVMHLNVQNLVDSDLGRMILDEIHAQGHAEDLEQLNEAIGFDPLDEVRSIYIFGETFQDNGPPPGMAAVVALGENTGNLEGWALTLPNYASHEYRGATIHSGTEDGAHYDAQRVYAGLYRDGRTSESFIVAGLEMDAVEQALDRVIDGDGRRGGFSFWSDNQDTAGMLMTLRLQRAALDSIEDGPPRHILDMIEDFVLTLGEDDGEMTAAVTSTLADDQRAEQVLQLVQGLVAAVQLPLDDSEEFQALSRLVGGTRVQRDGNTIRAELSYPTQDLMETLEQLD